jgi:hypothetical protein
MRTRSGLAAAVVVVALTTTACLPLPRRTSDTGCWRVEGAGAAPTAAASPDADRVWFGDGDRIGRLDPATGSVVQSVSVGAEVQVLAAGGDRVAAVDADGAVSIAQVGADTATPVTLPSPVVTAAFAPDGALWAATGTAPGELVRIDVAAASPTTRVTVTRRVTQLAVSDDRLWATSAGTVDEGSFLTGVDTATGSTVAAVPLPDQPVGLIVDAAGVWVSFQRSALDQLVRYDAATAARADALTLCTDSQVLTAAGGVVWSSGLDSPWVLRIDPAADDVSATTKLDVKTRAGAATPAGLWIRDPGDSVWFVDARTMQARRFALPKVTSTVGRRGTQAAPFAVAAPS